MRGVGLDSSAPVQEIRSSETPSEAQPTVLLIPDAPASVPKSHKRASIGFFKPLVLAVMLGAGMVNTTACAQMGAPLRDDLRVESPADTAVATAQPKDPDPTRGQIVLDQLGHDLEALMRVTARDMANPNTRFLENLPGYKEPDRHEVQRLVERALKQIPLDELPGGLAIARFVMTLPNTSGINAEHMSFDELSHALGKTELRWVEEKFRPLIEGHEVEAGLITFGAITAARAASPSVAGVIDHATPALTVWSSAPDPHSNTRVRLRYRNREILPNIDLVARTTTPLGPFNLRAELDGRLSVEDDRHLSGTATVGASWSDGRRHLDFSGTYYDTGDRLLGIGARRVVWELDYDQALNLGGSQGSFGVYGGMSMNPDGSDRDFSAGLVFRLVF